MSVGGPNNAPDITRSALAMQPDGGRSLIAFIRVGRPDRGMPPVAVALTDQDAADLSAKVRSHIGSGSLRYSPAECIGTIPTVITGRPDPAHISTSFIERQNWTARTAMRRYTRLSNGFSRKIENHMAAVAINYFAHNFIKIHTTLRTSPAMAAGVTDHLFDVMDLVNLLIESEQEKAA
jgi:hypothetical protein